MIYIVNPKKLLSQKNLYFVIPLKRKILQKRKKNIRNMNCIKHPQEAVWSWGHWSVLESISLYSLHFHPKWHLNRPFWCVFSIILKRIQSQIVCRQKNVSFTCRWLQDQALVFTFSSVVSGTDLTMSQHSTSTHRRTANESEREREREREMK